MKWWKDPLFKVVKPKIVDRVWEMIICESESLDVFDLLDVQTLTRSLNYVTWPFSSIIASATKGRHLHNSRKKGF